MMKGLFGLSLIINLILGYFLFMRKPEKEIVERVIIETHTKAIPSEEIKTAETLPEKTGMKKFREHDEPEPFPLTDSADFQEANERMESVRTEFLTEKLGMPEEKIAKHNSIRDDYFKKMANFWKNNPMREMSFSERKKMIAMEEELHGKLEKLHGKKNWESYQKFRESYNQKGYKRQLNENQPFLFMGL